jgi:hypothetical protein
MQLLLTNTPGVIRDLNISALIRPHFPVSLQLCSLNLPFQAVLSTGAAAAGYGLRLTDRISGGPGDEL